MTGDKGRFSRRHREDAFMQVGGKYIGDLTAPLYFGIEDLRFEFALSSVHAYP